VPATRIPNSPGRSPSSPAWEARFVGASREDAERRPDFPYVIVQLRRAGVGSTRPNTLARTRKVWKPRESPV
jgi:hypothetical protein